MRYFPVSSTKIYMPVDGPFGHEDEQRSAEESDMIISVTDRILKAYDLFQKPKFRINHGVAEVFLNGLDMEPRYGKIRGGYSGSLIRNDLDTDCFLSIIRHHQNITFEFWGENDYKKSNIHLPQDVLDETHDFLDTLGRMPNVILHGPVNSTVLATGLSKMDLLLICYKIKDDQNHHKVLEYLGTGKAIVSNYMSSYVDEDPDLIYMVKNNEGNAELPELFNKVVSNLEYYNSKMLAEKRKHFARLHSYSNNIKKIEEFISADGPHKLYHQS